MLTIFSWGYWGWGSTTTQLVEAVDAAEEAKGFEPPIFVDVRLRRSVRARGFSGNAFEKVVGAARYEWIPRLGNRSIATGEGRIQIDDPSAAKELLDLAIANYEHRRRLLFFCACADIDVLTCHRATVGALLLKETKKAGRHLEIVEWPDDTPTQRIVKVNAALIKAVLGGRKSVPLGRAIDLAEMAALPWGSMASLQAEDQSLPIVTGPAKYQGGWCLPVLETGDLGEKRSSLEVWSNRFRREKGLDPKRV